MGRNSRVENRKTCVQNFLHAVLWTERGNSDQISNWKKGLVFIWCFELENLFNIPEIHKEDMQVRNLNPL